MNDRCQIVQFRVDSNGVRIVAGLTVVGAALFAWTQSWWLAGLMAADFFIRGFVNPRLSPLGRFSGAVLALLGVSRRPINAGPKMFAAKLGFAMTSAMTLFSILGLWLPGLAFAVTLGLFATLEGALGVCVGCKMYSLFSRLKPHQVSAGHFKAST